MAKIQVRNFPDEIYARIEQAADREARSVESECRLALSRLYTPAEAPASTLTRRQRWQQETGARLQWLVDRLCADGYFGRHHAGQTAGNATLIAMARRLHTSPGQLMDIAEGEQGLPLNLAEELEKQCDVSADWLLSGEGMPFPVSRIGGIYEDFFIPPTGEISYTLELFRISKGRHEGSLFCLRRRIGSDTQELAMLDSFYLKRGMGSGGHGALKEFLLFLKTQGANLAMNTYDFSPPEPDFDFWSVVGQHHPVWFQDANLRSTARWLQQMLQGDDPADWFEGGSRSLEDIKNTPFGQTIPPVTGDVE